MERQRGGWSANFAQNPMSSRLMEGGGGLGGILALGPPLGGPPGQASPQTSRRTGERLRLHLDPQSTTSSRIDCFPTSSRLPLAVGQSCQPASRPALHPAEVVVDICVPIGCIVAACGPASHSTHGRLVARDVCPSRSARQATHVALDKKLPQPPPDRFPSTRPLTLDSSAIRTLRQ